MMSRANLQAKPILILLLLSALWGANMASVKFAMVDITPLFMCGIRSLMASLCLWIWMRATRATVFPTKGFFFHGVVVGLLFGGEFAAIYVGLRYTTASATYILLYTAPFFAAVGAHLLLKGDKLSINKTIGLIVAFIGVAGIFMKRGGGISSHDIRGDLLALSAGAMWGMTSVYVKKYLAGKAKAIQVLFYQLFFSAPFLFLLSFIFESRFVTGLSSLTIYSMIYQSIIIAFLSYLVWFELIDRYPISLLHAFSFFTPIFGVIISGLIMLRESLGLDTIFALAMVTIGTIIANTLPKQKDNRKGL